LADGHAAAFALSEPALRQWMPSAAAEQENSKAFVDACSDAFRRGVTYAYAVIDSGNVVGYCNATPRSEVAEIAYWIRSDRTDSGLGSVVARALVETIFDALPEVVRVEAHVDEANARSRRVAEKVGMELVAWQMRTPRTDAETSRALIFAVDRAKA